MTGTIRPGDIAVYGRGTTRWDVLELDSGNGTAVCESVTSSMHRVLDASRLSAVASAWDTLEWPGDAGKCYVCGTVRRATGRAYCPACCNVVSFDRVRSATEDWKERVLVRQRRGA